MSSTPIRLNTKTKELSVSHISSIRQNKRISICNGVPKNIMAKLASIVSDIDGLNLLLVLEDDFYADENTILDFEILKFLPNIKNIQILSFRCKPLNNIEDLAYLNDIKLFGIAGNLGKKIDFSVLQKFNNLSALSIDNTILDEKYYGIINNKNITELSLRKLQLSSLDNNPNLQKLEILNELSNAEDMASKFPNIRKLSLTNCKKLLDFSFISDCLNLYDLYINSVPGLTAIPDIQFAKLHTLWLLNCKKLENIHLLYRLSTLKRLAITFAKITPEDLDNIFSALKLEHFYFMSENKASNKRFEELAEKYQCGTDDF